MLRAQNLKNQTCENQMKMREREKKKFSDNTKPINHGIQEGTDH